MLGSRRNKQQAKCPHFWMLDESFVACMPDNIQLEVKPPEREMKNAPLIENDKTAKVHGVLNV